MSWIVEQSESASAVTVSGNTIQCRQDGYYGSPINVMYKDPADRNGEHFWEVELQEADGQGGGSISVGLTTEQCFTSGWGLRAMKYLGNLSDGSSLLVQRFGEQIKQGDRIGILLKLSDADLKMYIFHNEQPLGLAFHFKSPYPKPLYPVVSFDANGKVKIARSQTIPTSLDRSATQFSGVEGHWKIAEYSQHPECLGSQIEIEHADRGEHVYSIHGHVVNHLNCTVEHDPRTNQWKASPVMSTMMAGPAELMNKEKLISDLLSHIQRLELQGAEHLIVHTNANERVRLDRFAAATPAAVTQNIFQ